MSPDVWTFRAGKSEILMRIRSRLIVNTAEAAIDAAIADVGITRVLSHQVKKVAQSGALTMVLTKFESAPMPINFIYTGRNVVVRLRLKGDGDVAVVTCERNQSIATTGDADFVDYPGYSRTKSAIAVPAKRSGDRPPTGRHALTRPLDESSPSARFRGNSEAPKTA
jgi:hypothetical protein